MKLLILKLLYTFFLGCIFLGSLVYIPVMFVEGMGGNTGGFGLMLVCLSVAVISNRCIADLWPPLGQ